MRKLFSVLLVLCVVGALLGSAPAPAQGRPAAKPFVVARFQTKSEPHGVAVNPANQKVYVANQQSHNVTIYRDTEGGGVLNEHYVTDGMHDEQIAVNPSNNRVWITKWSSGIVIGVDGTRDNMVEQVNVDVHPKGVAVNPNTGTCYVVTEETNRLHVIGEGVGAFAHVGVGRRPKFVAVNPNTNRIYTSNYDDGTVTVVDGSNNTTLGTIKVGTGPYGIAVNPSTNRIYVANKNSDNITVIDGNSNTILANIGVNAQPWVLAVNPTNNRIYVTLPDNSAYNLIAIDGTTHAIAWTMKVGRLLREGIAVNPRTNRIYVTDLAEDYAYIVEDPPEGPLPDGGPWTGEYFANPNLAGSPTFVRKDTYINFDWGTGSPDPIIPFDNFSVRWTGQFNFAAAGKYTFYATVDDGVRLWVDNHLVIDQWHTGGVSTYNGSVELTAGTHTIRMEYFESTGNAVAKLFWEGGGPPPPPPGTYFHAEYWTNQHLQGTPTVVREDPAINFTWGRESPDPRIPPQHFSARWTGQMYFPSTGHYTFFMTIDDGGRLWVDGASLLDKWYNQPVTQHQATMYLTQGYHQVKMEYYQDVDYAVAQLYWQYGPQPPEPTPPTPVIPFTGEYWANQWLSGPATLSRTDPAIEFDWGYNSPDPRIPADHFSARWTGRMYASGNGSYTFYMTHDDGARLWVDNGLVMDYWADQPVTEHRVTLWLSAGWHDIRMEYYENTHYAVAKLRWTGGGAPPSDVVIVDDRDPGFTRGGPAAGWHYAPYGYCGRMSYTRNTYSQLENWGRWTPLLTRAGYWKVYVYVPRVHGTTTGARYKIYHAGTWDTYRVNQAVYYDQWVYLGRYYFSATGGEYVYLADATYESYLSREIAFDAVKWVYSP